MRKVKRGSFRGFCKTVLCNGTPYLPGEIFLEHDIAEKEIIEEWLSKKRGAKVHFKIPVRGQKHKMVEMAKENAQNVLRMDREKIQT